MCASGPETDQRFRAAGTARVNERMGFRRRLAIICQFDCQPLPGYRAREWQTGNGNREDAMGFLLPYLKPG